MQWPWSEKTPQFNLASTIMTDSQIEQVPGLLQFPELPKGFTLIGIHGRAHSGKDTVASYIARQYENSYYEHFADPIKEACAVIFNMNEDSYYQADKKEKVDPLWNRSPREILQFVGTEFFRYQISKLIPNLPATLWCYRMALHAASVYDAEDTLVVADVRFQDEYDWIINSGGYVIALDRPVEDVVHPVGIPGHASESFINLYNQERTHFLCNNSNLDDLYAKTDEIMTLINARQSALMSESLGF